MPPHSLKSSRGKSRLLFTGCLILSGLASYQFASWASQPGNYRISASSNDEARPTTLLAASQPKIDFGTIRKGGKAEATIWLYNPGEKTVQFAAVNTSCDCFQVNVQAKEVQPGGKISATAKVDLTDEPNFTGGLCLEAEGTAKDQHLAAFVVKATIRVVEPQPDRNE
jgi:hypothetical protein